MDPSTDNSNASDGDCISSESSLQHANVANISQSSEDGPGAEVPLSFHAAMSTLGAAGPGSTNQAEGLETTGLVFAPDAQDGNWPRNGEDECFSPAGDQQKAPEGAHQNGLRGRKMENHDTSGEMSSTSPMSYPCAENGDKNCVKVESEHTVCTVLPSVHKNTLQPKFCSLCNDVNIVAEGHCRDCEQDLCFACINRHKKMKLAADHDILLFSPHEHEEDGAVSPTTADQQSLRLSFRSTTMDGVDRCSKHKEEKLRFFCKTCQQPVCRDCILTFHKQHDTDDISDATLTARTELSNMMGKLEQKKHLLESYLTVFEDYKNNFQQNAQQVEEMVKRVYNEVQTVMNSSYHELMEDLERCRLNEMERIRDQELTVSDNIKDVTRLLSQHESGITSSILILSQHEVVSHALKTLDQNIEQLQLRQGQFFVSKNPRLVGTAEHFLGRIAFTTRTPEPGQNDQVKTLIYEVMLHRELAFNIWETSSTKSSVCSIAETSSGTVWVATSRSILKVASNITKDSSNVPDDITSIVAGPGNKLLVSFGQGSNIKLYSSGSWSGFASVPKGSTIVASRLHHNRLQVYVAVTPQLGTTKVLSYSTNGQVCQQHRLPIEIFQVEDVSHSKSSSIPEVSPSMDPSFSLKLSCMAVGANGSLYLGDVGGGRVVMVDQKGHLMGQYRGPDGQSRCQPKSICVGGPGLVVVVDSHRSTVELVSAEGKLLTSLLTREQFQDSGVPTAVMVDSKGRLWVGTSMGHVSSYSFLHTQP